MRGAGRLVKVTGRRSSYDKEPALSPFRPLVWSLAWALLGARPFGGARRIGGPQLRAALAGEALGLAATPSRHLGVVPGGQHLRNGAAFPERRTGELGVFE